MAAQQHLIEAAHQCASEFCDEQLLTTEQAAGLLMVSSAWVRRLAKEGWIVKVDGRHFRLVDVVQGHIRFMRDENRRASKTASTRRVQDARAREIEIRILEREGRLMQTEEALAVVEQMTGLFLQGLSSLPTRIATRDLSMRRTIEGEIIRLRQELSDAAAERAAQWKGRAT